MNFVFFIIDDKPREFDPYESTSTRAVKWAQWKRNFTYYAAMKGLDDDVKKQGAFFFLAGPKVQKVFDQILEPQVKALEQGQALEYNFQYVIDSLDAAFAAGDNKTVQMSNFKSMSKHAGETMQSFANRLREQVVFCGLAAEEQENAVKMQIIEKCDNSELRKQIFLEDRSLQKILELASSLETAQEYENKLSGKSTNEASTSSSGVCAVDHSNYKCFGCARMGHIRGAKNCPAKNKICAKCKKVGHFASCCRQNTKGPVVPSNKFKSYKKSSNVQHIQEDTESEPETEYIFHLGDGADSSTKTKMNVSIGGVEVEATIDSGTRKNIVCQRTWDQLKRNKAKVLQQSQKSDTRFKSFAADDDLVMLGMFKSELDVNGIKSTPWFYVSEKGNVNLIGEVSGIFHGILKVGVNKVFTPFPKFKGEI